jgi:hypothetical protein
MPRGLCWASFIAVFSLCVSNASGAVVLTFGAGSAVTTADRIATFDTIENDDSLAAYSEDGLLITVPDEAFEGFNAFGDGTLVNFHYGTGGNTDFVTIEGVGGESFSGIEFKLGTGFSESLVRLHWEAFSGGGSAGSGTVITTKGTIVGFSDVSGFDELRVIADEGTAGGPVFTFGSVQAIALDDVRAQLVGPAQQAVPEAASVIAWLAACAVVAFGCRRKLLS